MRFKPVTLAMNIGILLATLLGLFLLQRIWGRLIKRLGPTSAVSKATTDQVRVHHTATPIIFSVR